MNSFQQKLNRLNYDKQNIVFLGLGKINFLFMLGNNPKRPPVNGDGSILSVKEIFQTVQGEGPNMGVPAVFVRLGGCNLACDFCDTDFEDYKKFPIKDLISEVRKNSLNNLKQQSINLVVITGGEPFRQNISPFCQSLLDLGYNVQIETNGTLYRDIPKEVEIICSPKVINNKYLPIREDLLSRINAFKFLISTNKTNYATVPELGQSNYKIPVFVQPMDEYQNEINIKNKQKTVEIAINNGYRVSYQIHKDLQIK